MKDNLKIVLISGKARHGKTTVANMIKDYYSEHGQKSVVTSYNKYIKMYARELTDWDGDEDTKPRTFLQTLGSDIIREKLGLEDFYVHRLDEDLDVYNEFVSYVMIDDVRMPLEIEYFREKYPTKVKAIRVDRPNYNSGLSLEEKNHITEVGLDNYHDYDYTIVNDGTLDDLRLKVHEMIGEIL